MARARHGLAALVAAGILTGCGGDEATPAAQSAKPVGDESAGSVAQFADCGDWRAGTEAARRATVKVLRGQLTPQRSESAASPLPDERAYQVFQKACAPDYAESLRLSKLYVKLQGFAPLSE